MADSFTGNQVQGVFGKFVPVIDEALPLTDDNIQGIFGEFGPVLDEAAAVVAASGSVLLRQPIQPFNHMLIR